MELIGVGVLIIVAYTLGLINGQKIVSGEKIESPVKEVIKVVEAIKPPTKEEKQLRKEQENLNNIALNFENYPGKQIKVDD